MASKNMRSMDLSFRPDILNNQTTTDVSTKMDDLYVMVSLFEKGRLSFRTSISKRIPNTIVFGLLDTRTSAVRIQVFSRSRSRSLFPGDKLVGQVKILVSTLMSCTKDDGTHAVFELVSPWSKKHRGHVKFSSSPYKSKGEFAAVSGCDPCEVQLFSRWCQIEVAL